MGNNRIYKKIISSLLLILISFLLGLFTTSEYVKVRGIDYIEYGGQIARQQAMLEGHAGNPGQYRVLAPYLKALIFIPGALFSLSAQVSIPSNVIEPLQHRE